MPWGSAFAAGGEALYAQHGQACRLADGESIPGTYPFIGGLAKNPSTFDGGRAVVVAVTLFGLEREFVQRGKTCDGSMPGCVPVLDDEEVAAPLSWIREQASWKRPWLPTPPRTGRG